MASGGHLLAHDLVFLFLAKFLLLSSFSLSKLTFLTVDSKFVVLLELNVSLGGLASLDFVNDVTSIGPIDLVELL